MEKQIIILAAGKGSRMESELPKVMHEVAGRPMLEYVVDNCLRVTKDIVLVYSDYIEPYLDRFKEKCQFAYQKKLLGTAHAVWSAKKLINKEKYVGVIYGDHPLITPDMIEDFFNFTESSSSKAVTLAFDYDKPNQYGRILADDKNNFQKIVEYKFANESERKITLCNSGIMAFAPGILEKYIDHCMIREPGEENKELYLTKIIEICADHNEKVSYFTADAKLLVGINTKKELEYANSLKKN